jgi:hypothetical protein
MPNEPTDIFKYYEMRSDDECWPYIGHAWNTQRHLSRPYFMANGRRMIAYRWVYELVNGCTLEPHQLILHSCDNGAFPIACANPAHMRIGTNADNNRDMVSRQRNAMPHRVVVAIRRLLEQGVTQQEVANRYGVSREAISAIATRRNYRHVPD